MVAVIIIIIIIIIVVAVCCNGRPGQDVSGDKSENRGRQCAAEQTTPAHACLDHVGELGVLSWVGREVVGVEHAGSIRVVDRRRLRRWRGP